jgi:probable HAF family extracellular repeat protein
VLAAQLSLSFSFYAVRCCQHKDKPMTATHRSILLYALAFTAGTVACLCPASAAPIFTNPGLLPGGTTLAAKGVSADGKVVVGYGEFADGSSKAFRWTAAAGLEDLGVIPGSDLPPGASDRGRSSTATGVSADGSVVVGASEYFNSDINRFYRRAFRWTRAGGMQNLGALTGPWYPDGDITEGNVSYANCVSGDGSAVGGYSDAPNLPSSDFTRAFYWSAPTEMLKVGVLPGGQLFSELSALSGDGSVALGTSHAINGRSQAFIWRNDGLGMQSLGTPLDPAGLAPFSRGTGMSSDGSVVVGFTSTPDNTRAFRWTSGTGMVSLGTPAGTFRSYALAVSADGNAVVGQAQRPDDFSFSAFLWTSTLGAVDLNAYLPTLGVSLAGWTLNEATGASRDGRVLIGIGTLNGAPNRAWIVDLNPPCGLSDVAGPGQAVGSDGALTADDIIVYLNWFFASDARADVAGAGQSSTPDGQFTADDIIVFLNRYFAGC